MTLVRLVNRFKRYNWISIVIFSGGCRNRVKHNCVIQKNVLFWRENNGMCSEWFYTAREITGQKLGSKPTGWIRALAYQIKIMIGLWYKIAIPWPCATIATRGLNHIHDRLWYGLQHHLVAKAGTSFFTEMNKDGIVKWNVGRFDRNGVTIV